MPFFSMSQVIPVLQVAIGPVILISGVGLLLLSMTNRLAHLIDRARILVHEQRTEQGVECERITSQLTILLKRAGIIRQAIILASISLLLAALLIIVLFFTALFKLETAWLIGALFCLCMLSLIGSLIAFIRDLNQSLHALELEVQSGQNIQK